MILHERKTVIKMESKSIAKIISYNLYGENICASAAKISTTTGNAYEIFEGSQDCSKNRNLIKKVLSSGHKSIIEHMVFTIAMQNVSAYVEQFFIEFRLASFTVKSRRYVDFGGLGYYVPPDLDDHSRTQYCQYMELLFETYRMMQESGIPKEDARFILPYSFHSNFYCTLNARELVNIIHSIRCGRGCHIPELRNIADQIVNQLEELCPSVLFCLDSKPLDGASSIGEAEMREMVSYVDEENAGEVQLVHAPSQPARLLETAYRIGHPDAALPLDFKALVSSCRPRELEQLSYSFEISNITLSGITHIVRHRMQSIIIPSLENIDYSKFILPETIRNNPQILPIYENAIQRAYEMHKQMILDPVLKRYSYYMALSGNVTNIFTTMNARELVLFIRLRSCNRAQWEIRNIAIQMLKLLRQSLPEVFTGIGPACNMDGVCPEGKLSCGKMKDVILKFG